MTRTLVLAILVFQALLPAGLCACERLEIAQMLLQPTTETSPANPEHDHHECECGGPFLQATLEPACTPLLAECGLVLFHPLESSVLPVAPSGTDRLLFTSSLPPPTTPLFLSLCALLI